LANKFSIIRSKINLIAILLLVLVACSDKINFSTINIADAYNPQFMLWAQHDKIVTTDSSALWVNFVKNDPNNKNPKLRNLYFHYRIVPDYTTNTILASDTLSKNFSITEGSSGKIVKFKIKNIPGRDSFLLVLILSDSDGEIVFIHDILIKTNQENKKYAIFDGAGSYPLFRNHLTITDNFAIKSNSNNKLVVNYFDYTFTPALPPMATGNPPAPAKEFKVDSTFEIYTNTAINFNKIGLYFIQTSDDRQAGISIIVEPNKFPTITKTFDMVNPMIYILTRDERVKLFAAENPKKELDAIWLNLGGNKSQAKKLIKAFYKRVEFANINFTTYKPGWKTDKGMIYVVYGKPDEVFRFNDKEIWRYNKKGSFSEITFIFYKRENTFSDNIYDLERNERYNQIWYPMVEQWRNGVLNR
jgi:GWxTD domain-containing protein